MATDRIAIRLIRSAALGLVDFSQADRFDPDWHRRVEAGDQAATEMYRLRALETSIQMHAALLGGALSDETRKALVDGLLQAEGDHKNVLYPWAPRPLGVTDTAVSEYIRIHGDPKSKAYKARVAANAERYAARRAEVLVQRRREGAPTIPPELLRMGAAKFAR